MQIKNPNKIIVDGKTQTMSAAYYKGAWTALSMAGGGEHTRPFQASSGENTPEAWDAGKRHALNGELDRFGTLLVSRGQPPRGIVFPEDPSVVRDEKGNCRSARQDGPNTIIVDGKSFEMNSQYLRGALAAQSGQSADSNPFEGKSGREADRGSFAAGFDNETQGHHERYGLDLLMIDPHGYIFPELPRVNSHVLTDIVHGGHADFAALTLWLDREVGIAHLTGHSGNMEPLDGPSAPIGSKDIWDAYGKTGHYAIFTEEDIAALTEDLQPLINRALAGEDVGNEIQEALNSVDLAQAPYAGSEFDDAGGPAQGPK